jgi:hypothetical protein
LNFLDIFLVFNLTAFPQTLHYMIVASPLSYHFDLLHRLDGLRPYFAIVLDGDVAFLLELESGIDSEFFASRLPERLRPSRFTRILLPLEGGVTFRSTKSEDLRKKTILRLCLAMNYCAIATQKTRSSN